MPKRSLTDRLKIHGLPAVVTVLALLIVGSQLASQLPASVKNSRLSDIAVEHTAPLELILAISQRGETGLLDVEHHGTETIYVSLPSEWERTEVRHVPLDSVTAEASMLSFTRWTLPAGSAVRFTIPTMPEGVQLHHQSDETLELSTTFVDLDKDTVETDVRLVKGGTTKVW